MAPTTTHVEMDLATATHHYAEILPRLQRELIGKIERMGALPFPHRDTGLYASEVCRLAVQIQDKIAALIAFHRAHLPVAPVSRTQEGVSERTEEANLLYCIHHLERAYEHMHEVFKAYLRLFVGVYARQSE